MSSTEIIGIVGTAAFTVSGYLVGFRKRLDILGVVIVALLTAIGGGMIRDVLVGRIPQVFTHNTALAVIFITLFISWLLRLQHRQKKALATVFIIADAVGLAAFSITGAQVGLALSLNTFGVIVLGFVTAVGGGIVRDMLVNEVPIILRRDFYGSIAILMGAALCLIDSLGWRNAATLQLLFAAGLALRLLVHRFAWGLPGFQHRQPARRH